MSDITVHHSEQERKGCGSEERRVGLLVTWDTVGVYKVLVGSSKVIGVEVSWGGWPRFGDLLEQAGHARAVTAPSEARLCAFLMEQGGGKRAKRIGWVSLVVDVAVCSHFAHFIANSYLPKGSLAHLLLV